MDTNEYQEREVDLIELLKFLKLKLLYIFIGVVLGLVLCTAYKYYRQETGTVEFMQAGYIAQAKIFAGVSEEGVGVNVTRDALHIVAGHEVLDRVISKLSKEIEYDTLIADLDVTVVGDRVFQISYYSQEEEAEEMIQLIVAETISCMKGIYSNTEYVIVDSTVEASEKVENQGVLGILIYGIMGAFAGGFLVVFGFGIIYLLSPGIKSKQEIEKLLNIPVLADIKGSISEAKNTNAISILTRLVNSGQTFPIVLGIMSGEKQASRDRIAHAIENEYKKIGEHVAFITSESEDKIVKLKETFTIIIVDIPVLELNAKALNLAQKCDNLVITIEKNKTSYKLIEECLKVFKALGCDVKGAIFNQGK